MSVEAMQAVLCLAHPLCSLAQQLCYLHADKHDVCCHQDPIAAHLKMGLSDDISARLYTNLKLSIKLGCTVHHDDLKQPS